MIGLLTIMLAAAEPRYHYEIHMGRNPQPIANEGLAETCARAHRLVKHLRDKNDQDKFAIIEAVKLEYRLCHRAKQESNPAPSN